MNTSRTLRAAAAAVALASAFDAASARDLSASADVVRDAIAGHAYQNGGVGREQVAEMQRHMQPYDLRMTFSEGRDHAYEADVRLRVTDASGRPVFGLRDAGPLTDVSLPAGRYHVVADIGGLQRTASVDVDPRRPANLFLHWARDTS